PLKTDGNRFKFAARCKRMKGGGDGLWILTSPDGLRWKPFVEQPVMYKMYKKNDFDGQNQIFWDDRIRKYVAYVRQWGNERGPSRPEQMTEWPGDLLREVGRSETATLDRWPQPRIVFTSDKIDPPHIDFYNGCVNQYPFAPGIYFMFPSSGKAGQAEERDI